MKWLPMALTGLLIAAAYCPAPSMAQSGPLPAPAPIISPTLPAPPADDVVDLDTLVVSGVQPGPGMWKVSNGERVLWVMGTLRPLPRRMTWLSRDVESVIAQAQEVIAPPGVTVSSDVGPVRGLMLVPSLLRARRNPNGGTLEQLLPPELHARWRRLKGRYLGRSDKVESWRPIFAARKLYEEAIDDSGLSESDLVGRVVSKAARRNKVKVTSPLVKVRIEKPKDAIREFSSASLGDVDCFATTINRLETDLARMTTRANAWAIGDVEALRTLPYDDQNRACINTLLQTGLARKRGMDDLPQRVRAAWMQAAEQALQQNAVTFATLPLSELLKVDGYLGQLRAKGYLVEEP